MASRPRRRLLGLLTRPLLGGILLVGTLVISESHGQTNDDPRPSVLLIVVDTLRADHLGCYGYGRDTSPHIDRLAARGVRFKNTIAQSSWTLPSMISLMTGRYVLGTTPQLPGETDSLAELLSARGYQTAAFVANNVVGGPEGFSRGFDEFRSLDDLALAQAEAIQSNVHSLGAVVNEHVLNWVADNTEAPFFLYVHYMDPHRPYRPLEDSPPFAQSYEPIDELRRERYEQFLEGRPDLRDSAEVQLQRIRDTIQRYDADVAYVDSRIGELLAGLESLGLMENTVVALAADHGEALFDRLEYPELVRRQGPPKDQRLADYFKNGHGKHLYQELVATPLIFAGPGIHEGRVVTETVPNVAVLPTLLELATGDVIDDRDGTSLLTALTGETFTVDQNRLLYSWCAQATGVFHPKRQLMLVRPNPAGIDFGLTLKLFNLIDDPGEDHDALQGDDAKTQLTAKLLAAELVEREQLALTQEGSAEYLEATLRKMRELGYVR